MSAPDPTTTPVLIAFGSNIDPLRHLTEGLTLLHRALPLEAVSTVYRTAPVGAYGQPHYLNGAALSRVAMDPWQLKALLTSIEEACNRKRSDDRHASRTLDLDIAMLGTTVVTDGGLQIPDPDITERSFLAHVLAELAPELRHPIQGLTLNEIRANFAMRQSGMEIDSAATAVLQLLPTGFAELLRDEEG